MKNYKYWNIDILEAHKDAKEKSYCQSFNA